MLKFLENRPNQKKVKSPLKYLPEIVYGNSYESPAEFQTKHTIFHHKSYVNPFLKFEKERQNKIIKAQSSHISPEWTKKINISSIEEQKKPQNKEQIFNKKKNSFSEQILNSPQKFFRNKGEFSNFIDKNNNYKSIGPLQGIQRTMDRINHTKKTMWSKNCLKKQGLSQPVRYNSTSSTIKSSMSNNSQLIAQKLRIRRNRQKIQAIFKKSLESRQKDIIGKFELPKSGPEHQLYILDSYKIVNSRSESIEENGLEDLQSFEDKIFRKFK